MVICNITTKYPCKNKSLDVMKMQNMESSFVWLHRIIDFLIPPLVLLICNRAYELDWNMFYQNAALLSALLIIITNQFNGLYHSWRGRSLFQGSLILIKSWLLTSALLITIAFILKISESYSRTVFTFWFFITPILFMLYRIILRYILASLYKKGHFTKMAAIYGSGNCSEQIEKTFNSNNWLGYRVIGYFDEHPDKKDETRFLGGLKELLKLAKSGAIQTVYIALPLDRGDEIKQLLNELSDTTVTVKYIPDLFSFDLLHASMTTVGGMPVLNLYDTPLNDPAKALIKRLEDIIISTIILLLISPIMLIIAIGVKMSSPGPIFYNQIRIGWNGKKINMLKFRSMPVDTEKNGVQWGGSKNKATSKFGAFIRKMSLDELPQFINVLKGDMSIVGPRPERDIFVDQFRDEIPRYMQKHLVKAGITGWAQINGWRGDTDLSKRIEFDLFYIDTWSLWFDIRIIFLTVFKGLINENAY